MILYDKILYMPLALVIFLIILSGCNHNDCTVHVNLDNITKEWINTPTYSKQIDSFQYFLRQSVDEMLNDIENYNFNCKTNQYFILNLMIKYPDPYNEYFALDTMDYPDPYQKIRENEYLNKQVISFLLEYSLNEIGSLKKVSGNIRSVDTFVIPSNAYADIISKEDSHLANVNSLTTQLKSEIIYSLNNMYNKD